VFDLAIKDESLKEALKGFGYDPVKHREALK